MSHFLRSLRELVDELHGAPPETHYGLTKRFFILRYGGTRPLVPRRDSDMTDAVRELVRMGVPERTARLRVRGK